MTIKTSPSDIRFSDIREQLKHTTSGELKISDMLYGPFGNVSQPIAGSYNAGTRNIAQTAKSGGTGNYVKSKYISQHNRVGYNTSISSEEAITGWPLTKSSLSDGAAAGGTDENLNVNISEYIGGQGNVGMQTSTMNNTHQITNTGNMTSVATNSTATRFHRTRGKSGGVSGIAVDDVNITQAVFTLKSFSYHALDLPVVASPGDFIFVIAVGTTGATTTNYGSRLRDVNGNTVSNASSMTTYGPTEDQTGTDTYQFAQFWRCGSTGVRYIDTRLYSGGAPSTATYTVIGGVVKGVNLYQVSSTWYGYGYYISKSTSTSPYSSRLGGGRYSNNTSGTIQAEGAFGPFGGAFGQNERRMIFNITPFTSHSFAAPSSSGGNLIAGRRNTTSGGARFAYAIGVNESGATYSIDKSGFSSVIGDSSGQMSVPRCTGSGAETITFDLRVQS